MLYLLEIVFGLITFLLVYYFYKRHNLLKISNQFPGPDHVPFFGILFSLPREPKEIFKLTMLEFHKKYGKTFAFWVAGLDWHLSISDVKDLETVLSSNKLIKKGREYRIVFEWLGDGLLISSGKKWFQRRKMITPTFHFSILQQFIDVFENQETIMVDKMKKHVNGGEFDIQHYVTLCALDIINETAMGMRVNAQNDPNSVYVKAVHEASELIYKRVFSLVGYKALIWNLSEGGRRSKKALKILHNYTDNVIATKRNELLQSTDVSPSNDNDNSIGSKKKTTFLELLLKSSTIDGKPLSNSDIREEVDTFMFEGHDTTTAGIGFTLYHLSHHPDIQEKVYREILEVFGDDSSEKLTYKNLQDLKYLEMVLKESMRITPPVPLITRSLTEDTVISGVKVPANTNIYLPIYGIHHNEEHFPDPEKFDPERFNSENTEKRHPYAYVPFSAGARNCIGQKFAMLEMKSAIVKILTNYKLLPGETKLELRADLVLRSVEGIYCKIVSRRETL